MSDHPFPPMPTFSDELLETCVRSQDAMPLIFEWYKYIALVCIRVASISPDSPAFRKIPDVHHAVLMGSLNRCSRLMLSTLKLAAEGRFRETIALLIRCIVETAVKVQWLCHKNSDESFKRYLADGLKNDLILKKEIERNISERNGKMLFIEKGMLESIDRCVKSSQLTEDEILQAKQLPNLRDMHTELNFHDLFYTVTQRMGSHAVHGTWTDLIFNYLEREASGKLTLRDHDVRPDENELMLVCLVVVDTLRTFIMYISNDPKMQEAFITVFSDIKEEIGKIVGLVFGKDYVVVEAS